MMRTWNENWGTNPAAGADADADDGGKAVEAQEPTSSPSEKKTTTSLWDPRVWAMSFVACCSEGTIFLFMFFWPETLQDARDRERPGLPGDGDAIPHGVVFASFMAIMAVGALFFNLATAGPGGDGHEREVPAGTGRCRAALLTPTRLLEGALVVSAICFAVAAFVREEIGLFVSFLALEVCNGVYVPSVAYHRGTIVTDDARARVYSLSKSALGSIFTIIFFPFFSSFSVLVLLLMFGSGHVVLCLGNFTFPGGKKGLNPIYM